jgi:DNA-binding response OmpR family regulator
MRELVARVKAMLRRVRLVHEEINKKSGNAAAQAAEQALVFNDLVIDLTRHEVRLQDQALVIKPKEFELLLFLAQHRGQVLTREVILERVWGWDFVGDSRTVDVHVRWLREKIESDPGSPSRIVTVRGTGYRFEG